MKNAFLIHGAGGNPEENWFPWLKDRLEATDFNVVAPAFPTPDGQNLNAWNEVFAPYLAECGTETVLVGHSIGATFLLSILEQINRPVQKTVFVSGFIGLIDIEEFDLINQTISDRSFDWNTIRARAGDVSIFHGDNDPYVPTEKAEFLGKQFSVTPNIIPKGGHLNASAGFTEFPQLLETIRDTS